MGKDYYAILGVARNATPEEIKKAFLNLAKQYHPDTVTDPQKKKELEEKFKEINEANQVLSDPIKRSQYDRLNQQLFQTINPFDPSTLIGIFDLLDKISRGENLKNFWIPPKGDDILLEVTISKDEAKRETEKTLSCERMGPCPSCHGHGNETKWDKFWNTWAISICRQCKGARIVRGRREITIHITPGVKDGETIRFSGLGHDNNLLSLGFPGDLIIIVKIK